MKGAYRDPLAGMRARLADLVKRVEQREAAATVIFWGCLGEDDARRLRALEAGVAEGDLRAEEGFEVVSAAIRAHESYLEALEQLLGQAAAREAELCALPQEPPPARAWISERTTPFSEGQVEAVERIHGPLRRQLGARDAGHGWELRWTQRRVQLQATFRAAGAPIRLDHVHAFTHEVFPDNLVLATTVAPATPTLALGPAGFFGSWGGVRLDDPSFDGTFRVQGEREQARLLLTREVRADLMTIARSEIPRLRVAQLVATLSWRFEPKERSVAAAIRVLAAIRRAPVDLGLVNRQA